MKRSTFEIRGQLRELLIEEYTRRQKSPDYVVLGTEQDLARDLLAQALLELKREHSR